ncbi:conserved hypothetical protein [Roseibium sp. TrichSKD4]|uniref:DUF3489 domain-containing protein n=1 Tax=Roseibium sp. TrichSKD4 TaxID=744980 RepID=UPI0001E57570|nr:DUF3489 domain-containing protein [Roseibium sp. TrichSKD4]EFO29965.1 conserved hypothetical protein [Roseibium sp. TrichSKD4]
MRDIDDVLDELAGDEALIVPKFLRRGGKCTSGTLGDAGSVEAEAEGNLQTTAGIESVIVEETGAEPPAVYTTVAARLPCDCTHGGENVRKSRNREQGRQRTRQDELLGLLGRCSGVRAVTLCKKFGWQPHTLRAALSKLRRQGHVIERRRSVSGETLYIIVTGEGVYSDGEQPACAGSAGGAATQ